ncbi:hypothetical protein [Jiangella rhizosphaerae]|uniref:Uncharacterized protein n=1 Tax=Jiangella rhizosphaerae TaxID=2293569 RepID=A0A418KG14_9ACTN|nr:hypothetical protein [Jiangella rhizosphaerae]RIQ10908.1 hypothetical protein DY240_30890 [Jiangella rhizosphaerae]
MSCSFVRRAAVLSSGVVLALTASGCGSSDDDPSAGETDAPAATSSASSEPSAEPEPSTEPEPSDTPSSTPPETPAATPTAAETPAAPPNGAGGSPETTEAAIARFETFLHALGANDVTTMCAIAGPAAAQAEADGFGPCESTMPMMAGMLSEEQSAALSTATIDPELVDDSSPGQVVVPAEAIVADVTFTADQLGDTVLAYQDGDWFVVD